MDALVKFRIALDAKWASNFTDEELAEYIRERLNSSLGFRGAIWKFKLFVRRSLADVMPRV